MRREKGYTCTQKRSKGVPLRLPGCVGELGLVGHEAQVQVVGRTLQLHTVTGFVECTSGDHRVTLHHRVVVAQLLLLVGTQFFDIEFVGTSLLGVQILVLLILLLILLCLMFSILKLSSREDISRTTYFLQSVRAYV
jgi:hypothetical protein